MKSQQDSNKWPQPTAATLISNGTISRAKLTSFHCESANIPEFDGTPGTARVESPQALWGECLTSISESAIQIQVSVVRAITCQTGRNSKNDPDHQPYCREPTKCDGFSSGHWSPFCCLSSPCGTEGILVANQTLAVSLVIKVGLCAILSCHSA